MPSQGDDYFKPLFWLKSDLARGRCLPVDGTQERYADFTTEFSDPTTWIDKGHVVLITGDKGFGKTSLMQRCAHWMRQQAADGQQYRLVIVDLSDQRWARGDANDERMRRTLGRMLDHLALLFLLREDERARISTRSKANVGDAFYELATLLASLRDSAGRPVVVSVLLQGYPLPAEVTEYYNVADRGMFFFAEMFGPAHIAEISDNRTRFNRNGASLHVLGLAAVKAGDLRKFADWIRTTSDYWPEFPDSLLNEIEGSLILEESGILELAKMMWGSLHVAAENNAAEVSPIHVAKYYAMVSRGPRDHGLES